MSADEIASLKVEMAKLKKINKVLMDRVERSTDWQGSAFSLFQAATVLEGQVNQRTHALRSAIEELSQAKEMAEQANISKTKFLAAASHDLLQPLNAAKLFSAALAERGKAEHSPHLHLISGISESLESIDELLRALFQISKLDAGVMTPKIEDVPLGPLMERFLREYEPQVTKAGLQLKVIPTKVVVKSDALLLTRILWNFVSNAIRYTEQGRIVLGCRKQGKDVEIQVWDTGLGIPSDKLDEIFQEFQQVGPPGRGRDRGLGLGLAIVDRIARLLDHPLKVRSILGKGSMFSIKVPVSEKSIGYVDQKPVKAIPIVRGDLVGIKVMAVDDDAKGLQALNALLTTWGCHVCMMHPDGDRGFWMDNETDKPDIVIADFHLGAGIEGIGVIDTVRHHFHQSIPAFIVTSDRDPDIRARIKDKGLSILEKPIQPAKLRALMSHIIKSPVQPWH